MNQISRRTLLVGAAATLASPILGQNRERPPSLPSDLVRDFVGVAHGDFDKVKEMLAEHPTLVNACWDWSNGDFESAIGAAGHMGRRDIALYLIERGAQTDLHVHAMLGDLPVVKSIIDRHPNLIDSPGPHGIPLLRHAEKGGEEAKAVLAYLESKGAR